MTISIKSGDLSYKYKSGDVYYKKIMILLSHRKVLDLFYKSRRTYFWNTCLKKKNIWPNETKYLSVSWFSVFDLAVLAVWQRYVDELPLSARKKVENIVRN